MKPNPIIFTALIVLQTTLSAHDPAFHLAEQKEAEDSTPGAMLFVAAPDKGTAPAQAAAFARFAPEVSTRWDEKFLFIESNGLPRHNMMVGITAWQQQVPLPQSYKGANAWRIPLHPVPARQPATIRDRFLRGAIAIAANGIPIFNPQNNRGEISMEIGELDQWGGHCGRADDYHYHIAPLHLQKTLGTALPVAWALDGYPVFGPTEPDGSTPTDLDALHGHTTAALGYHYHASTKYPYVIGGFYGEVAEVGGQVDPQPRATPVREALPQLRGAKITGFSLTDDRQTRNLVYEVGGKEGSVSYTDAGEGAWKFAFTGTDGAKQEQTYQRREANGSNPRRDDSRPPRSGENRPPPKREGGDRRPDGRASAAAAAEMDALKKPVPNFVLSSPEIRDPAHLPMEFTGDGAGVSPPLSWKGAPPDTKSFALIMDHLAPDSIKTSWVLHDIPANTTSLPKGVRDAGKAGLSFKGKPGYEPPNSRGPGAKTYILTLYALDGPLELKGDVTRENLLSAMKGKVLASASLPVTHERGAAPQPERPPASSPPQETRGAATGLVKATMADTVKGSVYADNWFALYINGKLIAVDPIGKGRRRFGSRCQRMTKRLVVRPGQAALLLRAILSPPKGWGDLESPRIVLAKKRAFSIPAASVRSRNSPHRRRTNSHGM